jgi:hypothetical protein
LSGEKRSIEFDAVERKGFGGQSEGWTRIEAILELAVYG